MKEITTRALTNKAKMKEVLEQVKAKDVSNLISMPTISMLPFAMK